MAATPGSGGPWVFETAPDSNTKTHSHSPSRFIGRKLWRFGGLGCKNVYLPEFCFFFYLTVVLCTFFVVLDYFVSDPRLLKSDPGHI